MFNFGRATTLVFKWFLTTFQLCLCSVFIWKWRRYIGGRGGRHCTIGLRHVYKVSAFNLNSDNNKKRGGIVTKATARFLNSSAASPYRDFVVNPACHLFDLTACVPVTVLRRATTLIKCTYTFCPIDAAAKCNSTDIASRKVALQLKPICLVIFFCSMYIFFCFWFLLFFLLFFFADRDVQSETEKTFPVAFIKRCRWQKNHVRGRSVLRCNVAVCCSRIFSRLVLTK